MIAHHIEIMLHIWKNTPADLDCTQVLRSRFPSDTVAPQAGTQDAHIKDSVMGNKDTLIHDRLYLLPKLCKIRSALDFLRIYARELRVEVIEVCFGINERKVVRSDLAIPYRCYSYRTHTVVRTIRCFNVKYYVNSHIIILYQYSSNLQSYPVSLWSAILSMIANIIVSPSSFLLF